MGKLTRNYSGWDYQFYKEGGRYCCYLTGVFDSFSIRCKTVYDLFIYLDRIRCGNNSIISTTDQKLIIEFFNELDTPSYTFIKAVNKAITMGRKTVYIEDIIVDVFDDGSINLNPDICKHTNKPGWKVGK